MVHLVDNRRPPRCFVHATQPPQVTVALDLGVGLVPPGRCEERLQYTQYHGGGITHHTSHYYFREAWVHIL
jgi:hypothetical protein